MSFGFVTEITQGIVHDPMVEVGEGIELLKNEYPQKALVRLKRAFEGDNESDNRNYKSTCTISELTRHVDYFEWFVTPPLRWPAPSIVVRSRP